MNSDSLVYKVEEAYKEAMWEIVTLLAKDPDYSQLLLFVAGWDEYQSLTALSILANGHDFVHGEDLWNYVDSDRVRYMILMDKKGSPISRALCYADCCYHDKSCCIDDWLVSMIEEGDRWRFTLCAELPILADVGLVIRGWLGRLIREPILM